MVAVLANWVVAGLALVGAPTPTPDPESEPPALVSESATRDPRVAVEAIEFLGELPEPWRASLSDALRAGLQRGRFEIAEQLCTQTPCAEEAARHRLKVRIFGAERSYEITVVLVDAVGDVVVTQAASACDVCGLSEVQQSLESLAAAFRERVDSLGATPPTLEVTSRPAGAHVYLDDASIGTTPALHPSVPGAHTVRLELSGYRRAVRDVTLVAGLHERVAVELVRLAPAVVVQAGSGTASPDSHVVVGGASEMRLAGWIALGGGVAAAAAGVALLAVDSRSAQYRCAGNDVDRSGDCRFLYDTVAPGAAATAVGLAATVVGAALLWVARRRRHSPAAGRASTARWGGPR